MKKQDIFTISITDETEGESLDDMAYSSDYDNEDEAIDAAREAALKYGGDDSVIIVSVNGGEYKTETGDVYGDTFSIYLISNKDIETTKKTLESNGYSTPYADEYVYPGCIFRDGTIHLNPFLYKRPTQ